MKKTALLLAALCSPSAFAQLPALPVLPAFGLPTLAVPPVLAGVVPGLLPANVPSVLSSDGQGHISVLVFGRGAIVTVDSAQTPPISYTTVGLPALPGLP